MEALQRVSSQAPRSKGFLYDPHDTTGLPDWGSKTETDASRESSHLLMMPLTVQVLAPFSKMEKEERMTETLEEKETARLTRMAPRSNDGK